MNKTVVACLMLLGGITMIVAQTDNRAEMRAAKMQEMQAQKIAFIKEKVSFTDKESVNFFRCTKSLNSKEWSLIANQDLRGKALKQKILR